MFSFDTFREPYYDERFKVSLSFLQEQDWLQSMIQKPLTKPKKHDLFLAIYDYRTQDYPFQYITEKGCSFIFFVIKLKMVMFERCVMKKYIRKIQQKKL